LQEATYLHGELKSDSQRNAPLAWVGTSSRCSILTRNGDLIWSCVMEGVAVVGDYTTKVGVRRWWNIVVAWPGG
jgi:hypothetical protein